MPFLININSEIIAIIDFEKVAIIYTLYWLASLLICFILKIKSD